MKIMDKDISTLLQEVKRKTGWTEPQIATAIGTSQPTVNRILNGQGDCKVRTFRAIQELHREKCGETPAPPLAPGSDGAKE